MKRIEQTGKRLSRTETKKIQGGKPEYFSYCWIGDSCFCARGLICPSECGGVCTQVYYVGTNGCAFLCGGN